MGGRRFDPFPARVQNLTLLQGFLFYKNDRPAVRLLLLRKRTQGR